MEQAQSHLRGLVLSCRVCGGRLAKAKGTSRSTYLVKEYGQQLQGSFGISIATDSADVHPSHFCLNCFAKMGRILRAEREGKPHRSAVTTFQWLPHSTEEECKVGSPTKSHQHVPQTCTHMYACTSHKEFVHRFATTSWLWRKGDSRRRRRQQPRVCVAVLPGLEESIPRRLLRGSTWSLLQAGSQVVKSSPTASPLPSPALLLPARCAARSSTARCNCRVGNLFVQAAYLATFAQHGRVHAHVAWAMHTS